MAVSYKKLSHLLIERNMSHSQLQKIVGYSANITTRLKKDEYVSLETIESICNELDCGVDDILNFVIRENDKADRSSEQ
ncbi:MAG: helix-turn-helix transcriptional regulator [Candidatus Riflebacteria bacterium]|nr:helix-turn-helix transcriptional regulator [Candidatus Riflebacteria bacterium]